MARTDSAIALAEDLIRSNSGGIFTNENKNDIDFVLFLLDQFRGLAIQAFYSDPKVRQPMVHNSLLQPYTAYKADATQVLDRVTQKTCVIKFKCPQVLIINEVVDGAGYIGSPSGKENYRRVRSRAELAEYYNHPMSNPSSSKYIYAYLDVDDTLEIHGNIKQNEVLMNMCFSSPTQVPGFNIDTDRYPTNNAIQAKIKDLANKISLREIAASPEDRIQDFQVQLSKLRSQILPK